MNSISCPLDLLHCLLLLYGDSSDCLTSCMSPTCAIRGTLSSPSILQMLLVIYPPSRLYLFPPVIPLAGQNISATDPTSKSGDESLLAGVENPTAQRSKSEQAEEQSQEFMTFVERFGMKAIVGGARNGSNGKQGSAGVGEKDAHSSSEDEDTEDRNLKPAVEESNGGEAVTSEKERKRIAVKVAKEKRDKMVGEAAKATQDALGDLADFMERCHQ